LTSDSTDRSVTNDGTFMHRPGDGQLLAQLIKTDKACLKIE
jgi:hypothetical protein